MLVDKMQNSTTSVFSTAKVKEKNTSADEFQASLNEVKSKNEQKDKKHGLVNEDLDLGAVKDDFSLYAWQKLRESQHKKNEDTLLSQLFSVIDSNNALR